MGRPSRQDPEGGWHHVFNRGIRKTPIFLDDRHRLKFLTFLAVAAEHHGVELHGFCLVGNHYHLLVRCPVGGLSHAMHDLAGHYATWFNRVNDTDGPLCKSRFGSRLLTTEIDVLVGSAYVHRNSLDIAPDTPIAEYRWSSASQFVKASALRPDLPVRTSEVLALAGSRAQYWKFVGRDEPGRDYEHLRSRRVAERRLAEIDAVVALRYTCSVADVRSGIRSSQARRVAVVLAADNPDIPREMIALHYRYAGCNSLKVTLSKLRAAGPPDLWADVEAVRERLSPSQGSDV